MSLFVARIKGFVRFKDLMGQLVSRDLKLKYRRSVLGYLWSVLNPLFIMIIMAIVFSKMFTRASITNFPVYLMSGQVMFNFMNLSTKSAIQSIKCITSQKNICTEIRFYRFKNYQWFD